MAQPPSSPMDADYLQEEISINEAIYQSLEDQEDSQPAKEQIRERIEELREQLRRMQPPPPLPDWGQSSNYQSTFGSSQPSHTASDRTLPPPQPFVDPYSRPLQSTFMDLPNRKRHRASSDEFFFDAVPYKSRKPTPTPGLNSPALSFDSFDTESSDDPTLKRMFGPDFGREQANNARYLQELNDKRRQEEEDLEFARQLQEKWDSENVTVPAPKPAFSSYNSNKLSQSFLKPNGSSFQKPASSQPLTKVQPDYSRNGAWTPTSDDSSGLEEITPNEWQRSNFASSTGKDGASGDWPRSSLNTIKQDPYSSQRYMPGGFPYDNSYSSMPGASVYNNNLSYNNTTSSMGYPYGSLNSMNGILNNPFSTMQSHNSSSYGRTMPGSFDQPLDLDSLPSPYYPSSSAYTYVDPKETQEEIKNLLKHIRPDEELSAEQLAEVQPDELKIDLMPHQRKGFAWMKSMEDGYAKGGILADDMGLGKTVQALALLLARPPPEGVKRPTLIVAPVALVQQWEREIQKFVKNTRRINILVLHGENRNKPFAYIRNYDVVITTYGLLASDLKRKEAWEHHVKMMPDAMPKPQQECPVLGEKAHFHRVILDEAQNIKNKSTKTAAAACRIKADFRWCLSGTPMQNNVDEIYSLIKFCRIKPYHDFEKFSKDIGRPLKKSNWQNTRDQAMEKLQTVLRAILLRRTKKSEIDGKPILQLPEKHTVEERAIFSKDEKEFYKALETQAQIAFNRFLKAGSVGRNYSHALVLLLRLRQCCCSPQLITNTKDFMVNGAITDLDTVANARTLPEQVVKRLKELDAFECPVCMDAVENPQIFNPCGHALCQDCLSVMVDKILSEDNNKVRCPHCRAEIDFKKVTDYESFLRIYCSDREGVRPIDEDGENEDESSGSDSDSDSDSDDEVEDDGSDDGEDLKDFIVPDDEIDGDSNASEEEDKSGVKEEADLGEANKRAVLMEFGKDVKKSKSKDKKKKKSKDKKDKKGKGKKKEKTRTLAQLRQESLRNKSAKKRYLKRLARGFQTSTKIEKTVELLREIRENDPGDKTIIFSSFTSFLDLLEVALSLNDDLGGYSRYDGSMTAKERNEAVVRFTDDKSMKTMLVSLKAGNAGLNLTVANHVVILDPFWNPFVEHQAADRCHRIGQKKEVMIHRILIGNDEIDSKLNPDVQQDYTVEDRILKLQERKRELVETALDEKASSDVGRLGTRELGYLFGVNSL